MNALVQFGNEVRTVTVENSKMGMSGVRLMSASEYKKANGVKGSVAKVQYNAYLRENGKANTGELAKEMANGNLIVTGFKRWDKAGTWQVKFKETAKIKDPVAEDSTPTPVAIADVFATLTDEAKAAFIAQFIGKAA